MLCSDTTWPLPLIYTFISYFTLCLAYGDTYYSGCHIWTISRVTDNSQCDTKADETVVRWGMNWGVSKHTVNRIRVRWSYRSYFNRTSEKVMWWVSKLISIRNQILKCLNPKLTRCQRCDKLITFVFKPRLLCFFYSKRTKAPASPEFNESLCCDLNSLMSFKKWIFSLFSYCLDVKREILTAKLFICLHWSRCFILIGRMLQNSWI